MKLIAFIAAVSLTGIAPLAALAADGVRPGQWEMSVKANMKNIPKIPEAQLELIRQMGIDLPFGDQPLLVQQCITPEQAKLDQPIDPTKSIQGCSVRNYRRSGNQLSGDIVCSGEANATGRFVINIDNETTYHGNWSLTGSDSQSAYLDQSADISGSWVKSQCDATATSFGQ